MKTDRAFVAAVLFAFILLAACGRADSASELEGRWDGPGDATITLKVDGTAEGNDGCNDVAAERKPNEGTSGTFMVTKSSDAGCARPRGVGRGDGLRPLGGQAHHQVG